MCAVSCASCACKWESWRDFEAEVGTVERRALVLGPGVRVVGLLVDIFLVVVRW